MKRSAFIATVAALSLGTAAVAADAAAETRIVQIGKKYSKAELDAICDRAGGSAYGTADAGYGCAKGGNKVACAANGVCTGYIRLRAEPRAAAAPIAPIRNWPGNAELVLDMPVPLPRSGLDGRLGTAR